MKLKTVIYPPKFDEFIDPFGRYGPSVMYRAENDTEEMVDKKNNINTRRKLSV